MDVKVLKNRNDKLNLCKFMVYGMEMIISVRYFKLAMKGFFVYNFTEKM